jgi:hypothetical protein
MGSIISRFRWIGQRRGNRVGPVDASDLRAVRVIGIVMLVVAAVVTVAYAVDFDYAAYTTFRGELRTAQGTVTAVEPTDTHEPGTPWRQRDERSRIVAVRYAFTAPAGTERAGVSYRPGARPTPGARVTVEYPVGRPEVSRIRGYRSAKIDRLPLALYILTGTGAVLLAVGLLYPLNGRRRTPRRDD